MKLAILASGMVTGVGLTAEATCAAIRGAVDGFAETRFKDRGREWLLGCAVPLDPPWRGRKKLVQFAASAVRECLAAARGEPPARIPLFLCVAEPDRPGRLEGLNRGLLDEVQAELKVRFHPSSAVLAEGRVGGAVALDRARRLIADGASPLCVIVGTDSLLVAESLAEYEARDRLLTSQNSDGFIPGEAGAAVLVGPAGRATGPEFVCLGVGLGREPAPVGSEDPLRADGLVQALRAAFLDAGCGYEAVNYRLTDISGEQYAFKEAALGLSRTMRVRKPDFPLHHPADCVGEVGAAIGPCVLGVARAAAVKGYAHGAGVLCHFGNDSGARAAVLLRCEGGTD